MLLMLKKGIITGICHVIYQYVKDSTNKYMKNYDKDKKLSDLKNWDLNNLYALVISQKLPASNFKWIENTS